MNTSHRLVVGTVAARRISAAVAGAERRRPTGRNGAARAATARSTAFTEPKAWPDTLTQRWKITVGEGYSTPILVGNRVYQFSRQGENEVDARHRCGHREGDLGEAATRRRSDEQQHERATVRGRSRRRRSPTAGCSRSA